MFVNRRARKCFCSRISFSRYSIGEIIFRTVRPIVFFCGEKKEEKNNIKKLRKALLTVKIPVYYIKSLRHAQKIRKFLQSTKISPTYDKLKFYLNDCFKLRVRNGICEKSITCDLINFVFNILLSRENGHATIRVTRVLNINECVWKSQRCVNEFFLKLIFFLLQTV